jgi:predicted AAA+ superfamily ATPase
MSLTRFTGKIISYAILDEVDQLNEWQKIIRKSIRVRHRV